MLLAILMMVGCSPITRYNVTLSEYGITETYRNAKGKVVSHQLNSNVPTER